MTSAFFLLVALFLAPIIGGGLGELTNGILQILIFTAIVLRLWSSREWVRAPGMLALAGFLAVAIMSAFFTEAVYYSLKQLLFLFACVGGYLLAADVCRDRRVAAVAVWAAAVSALGICVFGIRDYAIMAGGGAKFWHTLLGSGEHARLFGTFLNPGFFAGFLVISLPVTLGVYLATRRTVFAALAGLSLVVQAAALMLTGTKFGFIAAGLALVVFLVLAIITKSLTRARAKRLLLIAAIALPVVIVFSAPLTSRFRAAEEGGSQVHSTVFRKYTWASTLHMIEDKPLTGVGPGAFEIAYTRYAVAGPTKLAHQSYLQTGAETGVVGLAAFLAALFAIAFACLAGILRGGPTESDENDAESMGWEDIIPNGGWRIVSCAVFAALVGSAARSLADSDWYIIGIALPFWVLAGVLAAQSVASSKTLAIGKAARIVLTLACAVLIAASLSFGLGDYFASGAATGSPVTALERALAVSPLNSDVHQELGRYLGVVAGRPAEAEEHLHTAIALAPTDAASYFTLGTVALQNDDQKGAIGYFRQTLKFNPHSTQALLFLANAYQATGDRQGYESSLKRLIEIESSPYERIKGAPEVVDNTFAFAHFCFGHKYLEEKNYPRAVAEFTSAIERLERWRSNKQMLRLARFTGMTTPEEEQRLLTLLRDSYFGLAEAYSGMGDRAEASGARTKGAAINP